MPKAMNPVPDPISFTFDKGAVVINSIVDSASKNHLITCDKCNKVVNLGNRGAGNRIFQHRGSKDCIKKMEKEQKTGARQRNLVSDSVWYYAGPSAH
jgi:hypothetical protein